MNALSFCQFYYTIRAIRYGMRYRSMTCGAIPTLLSYLTLHIVYPWCFLIGWVKRRVHFVQWRRSRTANWTTGRVPWTSTIWYENTLARRRTIWASSRSLPIVNRPRYTQISWWTRACSTRPPGRCIYRRWMVMVVAGRWPIIIISSIIVGKRRHLVRVDLLWLCPHRRRRRPPVRHWRHLPATVSSVAWRRDITRSQRPSTSGLVAKVQRPRRRDDVACSGYDHSPDWQFNTASRSGHILACASLFSFRVALSTSPYKHAVCRWFLQTVAELSWYHTRYGGCLTHCCNTDLTSNVPCARAFLGLFTGSTSLPSRTVGSKRQRLRFSQFVFCVILCVRLR